MVDVMDINKEREAFEAWYEQHHNGRQIACDYVEEDNSYSVGYANAIWVGWQAAKATPEGFVLLPIEPSEAIKTALSYQCFDFIKVAQVYRNLGFDIPKKAEDEQSFFLHKFLILAIKNGNDFIKVFNAETKAMIEAQEQSHENS